MVIAVDFDGTIVEHDYPRIGAPAEHAIHYLHKFRQYGVKIVLWTMRSGDELIEAVKYLEYHGVELYGINENPTDKHWTNSPKAYANIYIDDAAFGCPTKEVEGAYRRVVDWSVVGPSIMEILDSLVVKEKKNHGTTGF